MVRFAVAAEDVEPPADLWNRIEERIASHGRVDNRVAPVAAANDNRVDEFQRSARGWRRAFIAAAALAASLAAFIANREWPGGNGLERASMSRGIVGQKDGRPALIVNVDPASKWAFVIPVSAERQQGATSNFGSSAAVKSRSRWGFSARSRYGNAAARRAG